VVFIDLVGSTALSAELDLEDYKNLIRSYHDVCAQIVASHGGYVAHFAGDGVLAYFGYPTAQEDDPERAALAALAILREVPLIAPGRAEPLAARVGIATGEVLIGGLVYEGLETIRAAVGEIPNLAARLQTLAEPGTVIVSAETQRLLHRADADILCGMVWGQGRALHDQSHPPGVGLKATLGHALHQHHSIRASTGDTIYHHLDILDTG
jgi:class 3 adenylate cyclase